MATVSDTEVKAIIKTDYDDLSPFILVAKTFLADKLGDSTINAELYKEMLRWTAAHFVAVADPRKKEEKVGEATDKFNVELNGDTTGLNGTMYGRQAIALDPTGKLATSSYRRASFEVVAGTDQSRA